MALPVAQGILKTVTIAKQTGLGVPNLTASAGQLLRRVTSVSTFDRKTYANNEINPDQQDRGVSYGLNSTSHKFSGLLSAATYKLWFGSAVRQVFVAGVSTAALSITIAGAGPSYTVTRSTGSYITDGFKIGDVIVLTVGTFNAANINKYLLVIGLTATVATVVVINTTAMVAEGPIATSTVSVVGKKAIAPLTAQTNDYYTIEEFYSDIGKSDLFTDVKVDKVDVKVPSTGNCTVDFQLVGLNRSINTTQQMLTPTAVGSNPVLTSINGDVYINGAVAASCNGFTCSIDNGITVSEAIVGSNSPIDANRGVIKVSGSFTALFTDQTLQTIYQNETPVQLILVASADQTATGQFMSFVMGRAKVTTDTPDDGQKMIARTYNYTAEINLIGGGAGTAYDATILAIQDSAA